MTEIPHIIHYCWFGDKPLPGSAIKCIESWKRFFPGWEIRRCDESNFDVNQCQYTQQAYAVGKYAFVSDYARFFLLYKYGGVYFDTDVEVVKDFGEILSNGPYMGYETNPDADKLPYGHVNPGLGMGATPQMSIIKKILEHYHNIGFLDTTGNQLPGTVVAHTTQILRENGLKPNMARQVVSGIKIWPEEVFNPLDDATGKLRLTPRTCSIHWYTKSWTNQSWLRIHMSRISHRLFGHGVSRTLKRWLFFRD